MHDVTCVLETARSRAARATLMQTQLTHESIHRMHARQSEGDKGLSIAGNKVSLLGLLALLSFTFSRRFIYHSVPKKILYLLVVIWSYLVKVFSRYLQVSI